jgi:hypothetical protein
MKKMIGIPIGNYIDLSVLVRLCVQCIRINEHSMPATPPTPLEDSNIYNTDENNGPADWDKFGVWLDSKSLDNDKFGFDMKFFGDVHNNRVPRHGDACERCEGLENDDGVNRRQYFEYTHDPSQHPKDKGAVNFMPFDGKTIMALALNLVLSFDDSVACRLHVDMATQTIYLVVPEYQTTEGEDINVSFIRYIRRLKKQNRLPDNLCENIVYV